MANRIFKLVAEQLGKNQFNIKMEDNLVSDLGADSLDITEIIMVVEEEFNVEFTDPETESCKTVKDIVQLTANKCVAGEIKWPK